MMDIVRELALNYYSSDMVENGAADGAYSKNDNTCAYYQKTLNIQKDSKWIQLQWDYAHCIDRAEGDARLDDVPSVEKQLDLAQEVTKQFRYGKEFGNVCGNYFGCVSCSESSCFSKECVDTHDIDQQQESSEVSSSTLMPVIRSNLKFAAHGAHFLKNYSQNLPHYVKRQK